MCEPEPSGELVVIELDITTSFKEGDSEGIVTWYCVQLISYTCYARTARMSEVFPEYGCLRSPGTVALRATVFHLSAIEKSHAT